MNPRTFPSRIPLKLAVATSVLLFLFLVCVEFWQQPKPGSGTVAVKKKEVKTNVPVNATPLNEPAAKTNPSPGKICIHPLKKTSRCNNVAIETPDRNPDKIGTADYKAKELFTFNPKEENVIKGNDGVEITFPANCFNTNENVKVELQEYVKPTDIVLAGLSTSSNHSMLQTAGMVNVKAFDEDGNSLNLKEGKSMQIFLPATEGVVKQDRFQVFYGKDKDGKIDWVPDTLEKPKKEWVKVLRTYSTSRCLNALVSRGKDNSSDLHLYMRQKMNLNTHFIDELRGVYLAVMFNVNKKGAAENFRFVKNTKGSRYNRDGSDEGISQELEDTITDFISSLNLLSYGGAKAEYQVILNGSGYYKTTGAIVNRAEARNYYHVDEDDWYYSQIRDTNRVGNWVNGINNNGGYILKCSKIGWTNCDQFMNLNRKATDFAVQLSDNPDSKVVMYFPQQKGFYQLTQGKNNIYFSSDIVYKGLDVFVIAIKKTGADSYNVAIMKTTTNTNYIPCLEFKPLTEKELNTVLGQVCGEAVAVDIPGKRT